MKIENKHSVPEQDQQKLSTEDLHGVAGGMKTAQAPDMTREATGKETAPVEKPILGVTRRMSTGYGYEI